MGGYRLGLNVLEKGSIDQGNLVQNILQRDPCNDTIPQLQ